jgi:hypothetical protein
MSASVAPASTRAPTTMRAVDLRLSTMTVAPVKTKRASGTSTAARRRIGQALDGARDVVAEVADSAAPEARQLGCVDRLALADQCFEIVERIGGRRSLCQPRSGVQSLTTPSTSFHAARGACP